MEVKEPEFSKPNFEPGEFEEVLSESCEENTADMSTSVRLTVLYQLDNMCLRPSAVGRRGRRGLWFQWEFPHIHIFNTRLFQFEMKNVESVKLNWLSLFSYFVKSWDFCITNIVQQITAV